MITQIGSPTLFFTLSATNTKWPDLHVVLSLDIEFANLNNKHHINNVIRNPHSTTLYLHQHFTIFREEVIEKLMGAVNYWYRYEWKNHGSSNIHGFIWIKNAPNMDTLDWGNPNEVKKAK